MTDPDVVYLADHSVLLAIPAFLPALIVAAVVVGLAVRDRRRPDDEDDFPPQGTEHGPQNPSTGEDR